MESDDDIIFIKEVSATKNETKACLIKPKIEVNDEPGTSSLKTQLSFNNEVSRDGQSNSNQLPPVPDLNFLKNYKPLKEYKYYYGYNLAAKENTRLFVFETSDLVREYSKQKNNLWACMGCEKNHENYCKIINNIIYVPIIHCCHPAPYSAVKEEQDAIIIFQLSKKWAESNILTREDKALLNKIEKNNLFRKFTEFKYGHNAKKKEKSRIIVFNDENKDFVQQYSLSQQATWTCLNPNNSKCSVRAYIIENNVYVIRNHLCKPVTYKEAMNKQNTIKKKASTSNVIAKAPFVKKRRRIVESPSSKHDEEKNNDSNLMEPVVFEKEHYEADDIRKQPDNQKEMESNLVNEETFDGNELEEIKQGPSRSSSISMILPPMDDLNDGDEDNSLEFQTFKYPSTMQLMKICEKLNIPYSHQAYKFWNHIEIQKFHSTSKPLITYPIEDKEDSGFQCLSLLFAGSIDHAAAIQRAMNQHFFKFFKFLGFFDRINFMNIKHDDPIIQQTIFCPHLTRIHCQLIAKWLYCDLMVFENNKWTTFGKPEETKDGPTILLVKTDKNFRVVKSVDKK